MLSSSTFDIGVASFGLPSKGGSVFAFGRSRASSASAANCFEARLGFAYGHRVPPIGLVIQYI